MGNGVVAKPSRVASLSIDDMRGATDLAMVISDVKLLEKSRATGDRRVVGCGATREPARGSRAVWLSSGSTGG